MSAYRAFVADVWRTFGLRLAALVALMALVGVSEGLGVALLFPLLVRIGIAGSAADNPIAAALERGLALLDPDPGVGLVLAVLAGVAAMQAALFVLQSWQMAALQRRYTALWQKRLFGAFIRGEWNFLTEHKSGELVNAITTETGRLAGAFMTLVQLLAAAVVALIYCGFAVLVSWPVTLALFGLFAVMFLALSRLLGTTHAIGRAVAPLNARLQVHLGEFLGGAKLVKAVVAEERAAAQVGAVVDRLEKAHRMATFLPSLVRGLFEFVGLIALAGLLVYGTQVLSVAPANILVVLALFVRLFPRFASLQTHLHNLNAYVPAIGTVRTLLAAAQARQETASDDGGTLPVAKPTVLSLVDLRAGYGATEVLAGLTVDLPVPGFTGVVGESGAGKSTLVHCLMRLTPVQGGDMRLDGRSVLELPVGRWRRAVGFVPQETILFHASVRDNLAFAWPQATFDEIVRAARSAGAHDFISALPGGYDTLVGDQGVRLSGGQRQRLGIARALLGRPPLLLMDEPTSALDAETEAGILATLEALRDEVGIVVVSHRLATVRRADKIVLIEDGRLAAEGTFDQLLARDRRFRAVAEAQQIAPGNAGFAA